MYQALGKASAGIALNLTRFFPAVPRSFLVSEVLSLPPHHPPFPVSGLCLPSSRLINPREPYSCGLPLIPHIASGCSLLPPHSWSSATCKSTINLPLRLPQPCCLLEEDGNQICGRTRWRGYAQRGGSTSRCELALSLRRLARGLEWRKPPQVSRHLRTQDQPPKRRERARSHGRPLQTQLLADGRPETEEPLTHTAHMCSLDRGRPNHSSSGLVGWNLSDHPVQTLILPKRI